MSELLFGLEVRHVEFDDSVRASLNMDGSGCASLVKVRQDESTNDAVTRVLTQLGEFVSHSPEASERVKTFLQAFLGEK